MSSTETLPSEAPVETPAKKKRAEKPPEARSFRVLGFWLPARTGLVRLTVGKITDQYLFRFIPGGLELLKEGVDGELHHVHTPTDGEPITCDCRGFLRWNHCKHSAVATPLICEVSRRIRDEAKTV